MTHPPQESAERTADKGGLPVFKSVYRRLLLGSIIMPPLAAILAFTLDDNTPLPTWLIGLMRAA